MGYASTLDYLAAMARLVHAETGLLPHLNPGLMDADEIRAFAGRLDLPGGSCSRVPPTVCATRAARTMARPTRCRRRGCGRLLMREPLKVPFTSGLLIGIGETRQERLDALFALRDLHAAHGHLQEVIIQNFRPKPGTRMAHVPAAPLAELQWTIAVARLIFPPAMNIQAPPNLSPGGLGPLVAAGINDWGGVSPVTPDHVNPEAPLAASLGPCARHRRGRQAARRAPGDLPRLRARARPVGRAGDAPLPAGRRRRRRLAVDR